MYTPYPLPPDSYYYLVTVAVLLGFVPTETGRAVFVFVVGVCSESVFIAGLLSLPFEILQDKFIVVQPTKRRLRGIKSRSFFICDSFCAKI